MKKDYLFSKRYFGCHVSSSGGIHQALERAKNLGVNCMQIHPSAPQQWNRKPFPENIEREYLDILPDSGIDKVFFHGIYLINLATPDDTKRQLAESSLKYYLDLCSRVKAAGVVFHVGSLKDEADKNVGFQRAADSLKAILEETPEDARLLLEVSAGSGNIIGSKIEELASLYELLPDAFQQKVGFALDTQHLWASGYDLSSEKQDAFFNQVAAIFGENKTELIHLNDSKTALGSKVDRHENLGQGLIGLEAIKNLVQHPFTQRIPLILETPDLKTEATAINEVKVLESILSM
jgi:apurinic endonuclease APN1